ncbi:MAG TPA: CHAT domain-containing protein [Bacteroidales bacterium]|nr:CHAT domain-containing protein [Bacteroidales bacterium]
MKLRIVFLFSLLLLLCRCTPPAVLSNQEILQGDEAANRSDYASAVFHYQNFCNINAKLGLYRNLERESEVHRKMGYAYSMMGNFKKALASFRNAASIDSFQQANTNLVEDIRGIGNCHLYMGDYKCGLAELKKCIALSNKYEATLKQNQRLIAANVYLSLGNCYAIFSQFDTSNYYMDRAIGIFSKESDNYGLMVSLLKSGINELDLCNYNKAEEKINRSMKLANDLKLGLSEHYIALGEVNSAKGDYENAFLYKRKALSQADSSANVTQRIACNISLGDLFTEVGDNKAALAYYNMANSIMEKNDVEKKDAAAMLATRKGDYSSSLQFYAGSGATFSRGITLLKIGMGFFEKKSFDSCRFYLAEADKLIPLNAKNDAKTLIYIYKAASQIEAGSAQNVQFVLDSARHINQNPDNDWKIFYYQGRAFEADNNDAGAEKAYKQAIDVIETLRGKIRSDELKSSFMDKRIEVYDRLIRLLNKHGRVEESFNYSEKARNRAFLDMLARQKKGISYNSADSVLAMQERKLSTKIIKLREEIYSFSNAKNSTDSTFQVRGVLEKELGQTSAEYETFLTSLKKDNNMFIELIQPSVTDVKQVIAENNDNTILLEYWLSADILYIWCLDNSNISFASVPFDEQKYNMLYEGLAYFSKKSKKTGYYLGELYKLLIAPVRDKLKENSNLVIVPHGMLHFVPFHALIDGSKSYLAEHYCISYAPSASVLRETKNKKRSAGNSLLAMALGNLSLYGMPPLASTDNEVKNIAPLFEKSLVKVENECTVDFFVENAPYFSYLHLATHGVYNSKSPFSSYILFNKTADNDGMLKVSDIFGLQLKSNMVALSACQTGLGNISNSDELVGLSRAFIYAGTPSIVVSLWSVADEPTAKLMTYFYENLKTNPANAALVQAERKLMKTYKEPYFWAPFVLIGDYE